MQVIVSGKGANAQLLLAVHVDPYPHSRSRGCTCWAPTRPTHTPRKNL